MLSADHREVQEFLESQTALNHPAHQVQEAGKLIVKIVALSKLILKQLPEGCGIRQKHMRSFLLKALVNDRLHDRFREPSSSYSDFCEFPRWPLANALPTFLKRISFMTYMYLSKCMIFIAGNRIEEIISVSIKYIVHSKDHSYELVPPQSYLYIKNFCAFTCPDKKRACH